MTVDEQATALEHEEIVELLCSKQRLEEELANTRRQLEWFQKQYFGQKSEKRPSQPDPRQLSLGDTIAAENIPAEATESVRAHQRRAAKHNIEDQVEESGLRFDSTVPVETIEIPNPETEGLEEGKDFEVVSEKTTHRIAQRPASYVVLRYVRRVIKLKGKSAPSCAPAPAAVLEKSLADVSFLAGLLVDKFLYHLPLYRQHQRLKAAGIEVSRQTLTNLARNTIALLKPIYSTQMGSILCSDVLLMDETPIKAGRKESGKMHQGYFWAVYGDKDEVAFAFSASRGKKVVAEILGEHCKTLVSDGYEAYEHYAQRMQQVVHAQCWAHTRRNFIEAQTVEKELAEEALQRIGLLYEIEAQIREKELEGTDKLNYRTEHSRQIVCAFFEWLEAVMRKQLLLPSSAFLKAAAYALERRAGLEVFLANPDVPIDTNEIERAIRPIPLGRKNWLFCWTELGAHDVGQIQSLLQTCRLHGVDPYTYLVDVLQRIDFHPHKDLIQLIPRNWKRRFADNPLRSDLARCRSQ